jgi:hypothetical protein
MDFGGALSKQGPCLDTVRALHQTVVALRAALEQSRTEILELKTKSFPIESVEQSLRALTLENHFLKNKIVDEQAQKTVLEENRDNPTVKNDDRKLESERTKARKKKKSKFEAKISIKSVGKSSASLESLLVLKSPTTKKLSVSKTVSFSNLNTLVDSPANKDLSFSKTVSSSNLNTLIDGEKTMNNNESRDEEQSPQNDLEQDQDQEVDDIELIFTTDETKDSDFKEQLVSIDAGDSHADANLLQCPDLDQNLDISDRELDDDVFNDGAEVDFRRENSQLYNSKSDNSINQEKSLKSCYSYQDSSFENKSLEKDESFDRFDERVRIVETDISKCGIQDVEYGGLRRNTCPNPLQYRPLLHR